MHDLHSLRLAPGVKKTKGEIKRKSVIKPRENTSSSDITKKAASVPRFESRFKI